MVHLTTIGGDGAETWEWESPSQGTLAHANCSLDVIGLVSYEDDLGTPAFM